MKIYRNPWVSRPSYFVPTSAVRQGLGLNQEATGIVVEKWGDTWNVRKGSYYSHDVPNMPLVFENRVPIQKVIKETILQTVLFAVNGGKDTSDE